LERSSTAPVIVMPAHSASKTRVNALVLAGIHVFTTSQQRKGVDGRDEPGHDGGYVIA
jgi:hypothetical protein